MMDTRAPINQLYTSCIRGQRCGVRRDVRTAIQLRPSRSFEQAWSYEEHSAEEAYRRGYEEGLLAAQRQHLAQLHQASAAVPLVVAATQDTARQHNQQAQGGQAQQQAQQDQPCCADSVLRTAIKGLSWRFFSTSATILLAFMVLGGKVRWSDTLKLGLYEFVSKYILYFVHERIWAAVRLVK